MLAGTVGASVLAGGQSLIPAMNMRLANPSLLVDIQHVAGLKGIALEGGQIVVKAMTRHRELELDETVHSANPLIREVMASVAHVPIRNRGTVVGSLCHADAAAELPLLLVLSNGSIVCEGPLGRREILAEEFFQFHLTTTRRPDEIAVEARFSALTDGAGYAFQEFTRRHGDYAIAAVGCILMVGRDGTVHDVRIAGCGMAAKPVRLTSAEAALIGSQLTAQDIAAAGEAGRSAVTAEDDMHATQDYRRRLVATLIRRSVMMAKERANGGTARA